MERGTADKSWFECFLAICTTKLILYFIEPYGLSPASQTQSLYIHNAEKCYA